MTKRIKGHKKCTYCGGLQPIGKFEFEDDSYCEKCKRKAQIKDQMREDGFLNCARALSDKDIKMQREWIKKNPKKAREQMTISKGKI